MARAIIGVILGCAILSGIWLGGNTAFSGVEALVVGAGDGYPAAGQVIQPTEMAQIPAGEFAMTGPGGEGDPKTHTVRLDAFTMDIHEVTNAQYHAFCQATDRRMHALWGIDELHSSLTFPDHPVLGVDHPDAAAYAAWVGKRLPTEAEWEYAARGGLAGKRFDRGDELEPHQANYSKSDLGGTVAVAGYEPNGYGLYDMIGNLREWVSDYYSEEYFRESPRENPQGPVEGDQHVVRGGGWHSGAACCAVHVRNPLLWSDFNVGFRCAKDVPDPKN